MPSKPVAGGRRSGVILLALAVVAAGLVVIVLALRAQVSAPQARDAGTIDPTPSPSPSAGPSASASAAPPSPAKVKEGPKPLGASRPVSISIPAIDVRSSMISLGLDDDGTLAVPQPGPDLNKVAWFDKSPTPGQIGPSVVEGHVDSPSGASVFFKLGALKPGNRVIITRADGVRVTFTVNAVRDYKKDKFPTTVVYGATNIGVPTLRLITCSDFDRSIRHHVGNTVVFAHLTSTKPSVG